MDFFISYSSYDEYFATSIVNVLEKFGATCWIASRDLADACAYNRGITKAIESSEAIVLILSQKSDESEEVERELSLASQVKKKIIVINIDACKPKNLKYWTSTSQWILLSDNCHYEEVALKVLDIIKKSPQIIDLISMNYAVNICRIIPCYLGLMFPNASEQYLFLENSDFGDTWVKTFCDGFAVIVIKQTKNYSDAFQLLIDRRKEHLNILESKSEILKRVLGLKKTLSVQNPIIKEEKLEIEYVMSVHHIMDRNYLNESNLFAICEPSFAGITDDPSQIINSYEEAEISIARITPAKAHQVINTISSKNNIFYVSWANVILVDDQNPSNDFELLVQLELDLQKLWYKLFAYDNLLDKVLLNPEIFDEASVKKELLKTKIEYSKLTKINPTGAGHYTRLKESLIETSKIQTIWDSINDKLSLI